MESTFHMDEASNPGASDTACPVCGHAPASTAVRIDELRQTATDEATRVVQGTAEPQPIRISYMPARVESRESRALVPAKLQYPALARLAQLPALAWRQPAVRSAVKTGASAVALSVAVRAAGRVLASRAAREAARESLLPTLTDLMS